MSRRHAAEKRSVLPDPKFGDIVVTKFMNVLMYDGKKSAAEKIVYGAFDRIAGRTGGDGVSAFREALENVAPKVEVRSRRVWRRDLSGAHGCAGGSCPGPGHSLADRISAQAV